MRYLTSVWVALFAAPLLIPAPAKDEKPGPHPDPAATKLLADARAARLNWTDFPGFAAGLSVNIDGKVHHGQVTVQSDGKLKLDLEDKAAQAWARRVLGSTVSHRLDSGSSPDTPCAFADDVTDHPLGRAILVLNDEFHSSYRIRDRQVIVVNRNMPQQGIRFTITVLRNIRTKDKKFLPASFVVSTWDTKIGGLRSTETHHQTWKRVGKFWLPRETLVVTATADKLEARSLKLADHRLLGAR
jgi:hypothetical protein